MGSARAALVFSLLGLSLFAQEIPPKKFSVRLSATVQESPPRITLAWPNDGDASSYTVSRRTLDSGWQQLGVLGGGASSFEDGGVSAGTPYEYQVVKQSTGEYRGYGYLRSGIRVPSPNSRGKVILLVENNAANALGAELERLQRDLTADGWGVIRRTVSMNDSPQSVKQAIVSLYNADPANVHALFLFGHVPVPYSGDIFPDGHPNHKGAWPADLYYGDMDGLWTDHLVNNVTAERQINWNVPGDGKFDQSEIPSEVELMVGRVDLFNMTSFANKANSRSEIDLLRQYLNKNHAFRVGDLPVERRALICDNFGDKGNDPIAGSAWRSFPGAVGNDRIQEVPWDGYFPAATSGSYLWSYGSGGGSYYYSMGVGTSDDFALRDVKVVFTMFMGSYFGDWNNESNFLRAALGSGYVLASSYSGFPHALYFPMSLGEPIGYAMRLAQNNKEDGMYPPDTQGSGQVHVALMGDPTLRLHPVKPAANLNIATEPGRAQLTWNASPDSNITGYHVYRGTSPEGPFTRVTDQPVNGGSWADTPAAGSYVYMVRAIKLEQSPSGTYLNPSLGIMASANVTGSPTPEPPDAPVLNAEVISHSQVNLRWTDVARETGYQLERKTTGAWSQIATLGAGATSFSDQGLAGSTEYFYRVRALNDAGASGYSAEARVTTPAAPQPQATVRFVEQDSGTSGNWPEKFGAGGIMLAAGPSTSSLNISVNGAPTYIWEPNTTDARAPLTAPGANTRIASGWHGDSLNIDVDATSGSPQRVALYFLDWDRGGRAERVTVNDTATGTVLDTREVASFGEGVYLVYDLQGKVRVNLSKTAGSNALLNGIFVGGPVPPPVSDDPVALAVRAVSPTQLMVTVRGTSGQRFRLEFTGDFQSWSEVMNGALSGSSAEVPVAIDSNRRGIFLRAVNTR